MAVNDLATEIVRIVTVGVQEALAGIEAVSAGLIAMGGASLKAAALAGGVGRAMAGALAVPSQLFHGVYTNLRTLARELSGLAQLAARLAFGGGLGLAGIIRGAAKGTQEADQFGKAMTYLVRVLGDAFAPYVRAAAAGLTELSQWFRTLSTDTRESIAQWALITAGTLAFVSTLPMIVRGVGSVAAILSLLTSPTVLIIAAFAAVTAAAARMFGFFETGGADAADSLNQSNESWLGSLIKGIGAATAAAARMFNWILTQAAKVSDWIAEQMAKAGEFLGIVPEGTVDTLRKMPPIQAPQIDVGAVEGFFEKVRRGAEKAGVDFTDLMDDLQKAGGLFDRLRQKANFGQGFHLKMDVGFESLQGTFERLQKSVASQGTSGIEQAQLGQLQEINQGMQKAAAGITDIGKLVPAVR